MPTLRSAAASCPAACSASASVLRAVSPRSLAARVISACTCGPSTAAWNAAAGSRTESRSPSTIRMLCGDFIPSPPQRDGRDFGKLELLVTGLALSKRLDVPRRGHFPFGRGHRVPPPNPLREIEKTNSEFTALLGRGEQRQPRQALGVPPHLTDGFKDREAFA